jgi:putative membrane protein
MKKVFLSGSLAIFLFLAACKKNDNNNNNVSSTDQNFMAQVAMGNRGEIGAAALANTKSSNAGVKAFAQFMIQEHTQAQTDLQNLANNLGQTLPSGLMPGDSLLMVRLSSLSGLSFDTAYINAQVLDHQKVITVFQNEINAGNNQSIRAYANQYLPHIQLHLRMADSLQTTLH